MEERDKKRPAPEAVQRGAEFRLSLLGALLVAGTMAATARAERGPFIQLEEGNRVRLAALGFTYPGWRDLAHGASWRVDTLWQARVAYWRAEHSDSNERDLWEVGLVPTVRLAATAASGFTPFLDAGIGAHLLSRTRIDNRLLGTAFQFGEHVALGTQLGPHREYSLALRAEHISNGRIKRPNDGMTFFGVHFQASW